MSGKIDFRFRLKLKITLVESTYPSQFLQCPSLSPHFLLILINIFISLWKSVWKFTTDTDKMCIDLMRNTSLFGIGSIIAAAASEPEASERGSSLISRRLHYRGLQSLFPTKRKELCLCAKGRFRMRSGMPQGIVVMR